MGLLSRFLGHLRPSENTHDPDLDEALDRAAYRVEPRLKQTRAWPKRYRRPIAAALAQARHLAEAIPGPVEIDAEHYIRDPFVHALFASPDDIHRAVCSNPVMRRYVAAGNVGEVYVLLTMRRQEKRALGIENFGGVMRRDVSQHLVWFTDHQVEGPAPTLAEARRNMMWILFDRFLDKVASGVDRIRAERAHLVQEKDFALARLRGADPARRADLQIALDQCLSQLGEATRFLDYENLAEVFETVLSHPEDCLYLQKQELILDSMGVVRQEGGGSNATRLSFFDLHERESVPRTVVLAYCRDIHPMTRSERLQEAEQLLG